VFHEQDIIVKIEIESTQTTFQLRSSDQLLSC
jgi:hypothetical protein